MSMDTEWQTIIGPMRHDKKNSQLLNSSDHQFEQLLRGGINPMSILQHAQYGNFFGHTKQKISEDSQRLDLDLLGRE